LRRQPVQSWMDYRPITSNEEVEWAIPEMELYGMHADLESTKAIFLGMVTDKARAVRRIADVIRGLEARGGVQTVL